MTFSAPLVGRAACTGPLSSPVGVQYRRRAAVVAHARQGPRRRWWSDAWEDDSAGSGGGGGGSALDAFLDGGSSVPAFLAEEVTTFFCSDGSVVRLGQAPHPLQQAERRTARGRPPADALPLPAEQGLCIGSVFTVSATNGIEPSRRINLLGFCFSTEQLFERVEQTVLARGGEVFETQRQLKSGVHECLHMTVAIPLLWGVPPEYERLEAGIKTGGGIIERVVRQWVIY